ncbi:MAG: aldehyde:ferredoxin oxidoreductase [Acidobacteria bacterium]|nr:aldehyde:ferredoxin oxidoreductase [Acidobacteriota bacterium]
MSVTYDYKVRTNYAADVSTLRAAHKTLVEVPFTPSLPERGYTRRTLFVDLSTLTISEKAITQEMIDVFTGGRGFGLYYLWQAVTPGTKWNDPENALIISPGPLAGNTQYAGSGKSLVVTISPETGIPIDCNVGGYFGPLLKFCGFDVLDIRGKAKHDTILVIDGPRGVIRLEEAPEEAPDSHIAAEIFTHMYADDARDMQNVAVVSAGKAAESAYMGCLNFSWWDPKRGAARLKQAGRGGTGTVFRDKKLKALVVRGFRMKTDMNRAADFPVTVQVGKRINDEIRNHDDEQCHMRRQGTAHLVEVMDAYDLLPVHNFQYGKHVDTPKIDSQVWDRRFTQGIPDQCWYGCGMACSKAADGHHVLTGPYKGHIVTVDGPEYENAAGLGSNCGLFDPDWLLEVNFYCDTYGIDTISFGTACAFVMECWEKGILNAERTGGLDLAWGNGASEVELLHQMARGEGFGITVGKGVKYMQDLFIRNGWGDPQLIRDMGMQIKGLEISQYMCKESLAQQGGFALANKGPQHDEAWLIFMDMVNNQIPTFEDKAEALHYFPLFRTWFGLQGLCKLPWNDIEPPDNHEKYPGPEAAKVPEHVENYLKLYTGITGKPLDRKSLIEQSEAVYNFQRVFNLRMGQGDRKNDMPPYRAMGPVTKEEYESRAERYDKQLKEIVGIDPAGKSTEEKMTLQRAWRTDRYNKLVDAVYKRRGWTPDGVPTMETLKKLKIDSPEVVAVVAPHLG